MKRIAAAFVILVLAAGLAACGGGDEPQATDSDGDGWTDAWEEELGTDPFNTDTDGDGHKDSLDCDPLDPSLPAPTPSPTAAASPTASPRQSPAATPTVTPGPVPSGPAESIPAAVLQECYERFRSDYDEVTTATAYQSADAGTIFLSFVIHWEVPHDRAEPLGEAFVRLVKAKVDVPPGVKLGPGTYNYVSYIDNAGGQRVIQGTKCAECDSMTWGP